MANLWYLVLFVGVFWKANGENKNIFNTLKSTQGFKCPERNGLFQHPDRCGFFIECSHGQPHKMRCPHDRHFSDETKRCEDPCEAHCDESLACECRWNSCEEKMPTRRFRCGAKNGLFRNPEDCSTFYECSDGEQYLMRCPNGLHYSDKRKHCEKPCDAHCDKSISSECSWHTTDEREYADIICAENGLFKDPESCSSYIHCVDGQKYDMPCPTGYHFNERTKLCEPESEAQCQEYKDPECQEDGTFMDLSGCNSYLNCSEGRKSVKYCPEGLHFSEETKGCESPCDARCDQSLALQCGWPVASETAGNCPENEQTSLCGAACQRNCTNYNDWFLPCYLMPVCRPGCVCNDGFVRNSEGKCIPTEECQNENVQAAYIDFHCPFPIGKFLFPANLHKYYNCEDDIATLKDCQRDWIFDYIKQECVRR